MSKEIDLKFEEKRGKNEKREHKGVQDALMGVAARSGQSCFVVDLANLFFLLSKTIFT